jgi:hypothetical protein
VPKKRQSGKNENVYARKRNLSKKPTVKLGKRLCVKLVFGVKNKRNGQN